MVIEQTHEERARGNGAREVDFAESATGRAG